jgi:signal transduction histidine kinase
MPLLTPRSASGGIANRAREGHTVLLVDDEPGNLEVLQSLLEDELEVRVAASGAEALAVLAAKGPVDLIIADQRMPGMTGVELLTEVARRHPATLRIVLTAYSDVEPMLAAANHGLVYRFLLKPCDPIEFRGIVADALHVKARAMALLEMATALEVRRQTLEADTERLRLAQERLLAEERLSTLGRLVGDMAGELQALSGSLSLLLGLIRQTESDARVLHDAEQVWRGLGALRELLAQVRDYTRPIAAAPDRVRLPPRTLIRDTMDLFLAEEIAHRCPVTAEIDGTVGVLLADPGGLQQALLALLRNAVRASPEGRPVHLAVRRGVRETLRLEVRDEGPGMTPELARRAREPFFSGERTPGIGLGLEIARLAAAAHGGWIELDSAPGEGTRASLVLPAAVEVPRDA